MSGQLPLLRATYTQFISMNPFVWNWLFGSLVSHTNDYKWVRFMSMNSTKGSRMLGWIQNWHGESNQMHVNQMPRPSQPMFQPSLLTISLSQLPSLAQTRWVKKVGQVQVKQVSKFWPSRFITNLLTSYPPITYLLTYMCSQCIKKCQINELKSIITL